MGVSLMKLNKRESILLVIVLVLGLGVVYYQFFYTVHQEEQTKLKAQLNANSKKLEQVITKQKNDNDPTKSAANLDIEMKSIERNIPYIKDMPGLFVELYYKILEYGLESNNISFSNINQMEKFNYFNISLDVKGNKENVNGFLQQLENFNREISISAITFTPSNSNGLNVKISMKVYTLKSTELQSEPKDYDFMEGKYGTFKDVFDMFKSTDKFNIDKGLR